MNRRRQTLRDHISGAVTSWPRQKPNLLFWRPPLPRAHERGALPLVTEVDKVGSRSLLKAGEAADGGQPKFVMK